MSDDENLPVVDETIRLLAEHAAGGLDAAALGYRLAGLDYQPLRADLAACLTEAGIALHDCDGPGRPVGGCCLTAKPQRDDEPGGVIVAWTCADSLADGRPDGDRYNVYETVQSTMTEALWAILDSFGFPLTPFGMKDLPLVTGMRPVVIASPRPHDEEDLAVADSPAYGEPFADATIIDDEGRLGRPCASCGKPYPALHYPQASDTSGVCCGCWDGRVLVATDEHPDGEWRDLGRCHGVHDA